MSAITEFLEGRGCDGAGRGIETVLALEPRLLEAHHDFIQWLFPLPQASGAVPGSPVLIETDIACLRQSDIAQLNLDRAKTLMADFYAKSDDWLRPHDHNHLRITRIIKSLRLLTDDATADAFRVRIENRVAAAGAPVNATSRVFWMQA